MTCSHPIASPAPRRKLHARSAAASPHTLQTALLREQTALAIERLNAILQGFYGVASLALRHGPTSGLPELDLVLSGPANTPVHHLQCTGVSKLRLPALHLHHGEPLFTTQDLHAHDLGHTHPDGVLYRIHDPHFSFTCLSFFLA